MEKNINTNKPVFLGTAPMWDNTPRRSYKGLEYTKVSSVLFYKHLINIKQNLEKNSSLSFVYINSWNEWGMGQRSLFRAGRVL